MKITFIILCLAIFPPLHADTRPLPSFVILHKYFVDWFVGAKGFGLSRMPSVEQSLIITRNFSFNGIPYHIRNLQLISIIKHDPPGAYLIKNAQHSFSPYHSMSSSTPPRMKEIDNYTLRPLDESENGSLTLLKKGKDILVTPSGIGDIKILGAIRATTSCLNCHQVKEGELLGAFSYSLAKLSPLRNTAQQDAAANP